MKDEKKKTNNRDEYENIIWNELNEYRRINIMNVFNTYKIGTQI